MYSCIPSRKIPEGWKPPVWRSGLPRYAMRLTFRDKILEFSEVFAASHAGTLPPPPPKLVRQNACMPTYWDDVLESKKVIDLLTQELIALEEGRKTPVKTAPVPVAPFAPVKVAKRLFDAETGPPPFPPTLCRGGESDDDMYV